MIAARRTRGKAAAAAAGHETISDSIATYSRHEAVNSTLARFAIASSSSSSSSSKTDEQRRPATTMASARKGKPAAARQSGSNNGSGQLGGLLASTDTVSPPVAPATTTTTSTVTTTSKSTRPAARSSSRRQHAHQQEDEEQPSTPQLHDIPPNVLQAQGLAAISTSLIDNLPEPSFPKKGIALHPSDQNDPLLVLCGKVLASVSNRALTPKEIALVLARRHGWQFSGSQPFAVVSSCIRSHVRRANLAIPPYNPIFTPYELSSIPPPEDIPCLGIEAASKPVVKRGTFWFLSENMGYGYPFPHRRGAASIASAPPSTSTSTTPATSSTPSNTTSASQAQSQAQQSQNRRSSSRHQPSITPTQPIPIMPAPPATTAITTSSSLPTLAPRSDAKTDRLTRAQKSAQHTLPEGELQLQQQAPFTAQSAPVPSNMASLSKNSGWKRKRPHNKAVQQQQANLADNSQASSIYNAMAYPHLQELPTGTNEANIQPSSVSFVKSGNKKASSSSSRSSSSTSQRRPFSSSSTSDGSLARPAVPALRKLKLRLSSVSESASLDPTSTSVDLQSASLPATTKRVTLLGKSTSSSSSKHRKSKRARTQSMSHHTNTTASFPFDDLHLYHSMQQNQTLLHYNSPTSSTSTTTFSHNHGEGTLFPFEMHMPSSSPNGVDLLLTSRSAPEGGNLFSPALAAAAANTASAQHVAGPFSRSHSPSTSMHHYRSSGRRSLPPPSEYENEDSSSLQTSIDLEYDGWGMDSDHLARQGGEEEAGGDSQGGRGGKQEEDSFHEAMLKNDDIDFEFDFSLGSLGKSASRFSILNPDESNLSLEEVEEDDQGDENEGDDRSDEETVTAIADGRENGGIRRSMSILESLAVDAVLDGLDKEQHGDSLKTTLSNKKRPSLSDRRKSSASEADSIMEEDEVVSEDDENEVEREETSQIKTEDSSSASRIALFERRAFERALNTTLCPAAAKFGEGSAKPARLLAKRMNSSSSLTFPRASVPSIRTSDLPADLSSSSPVNNSSSATSTINPLLRPSPASRRNSRDVLSSAVPLAELPSIPLEDNRRDSFLFYHLTSDADPPSYFNDGFKSSPPRIDRKGNDGSVHHDRDDDMSDAASSSSASTSSSLLTRIVKSEEELDEMVDMEEEGDEDGDEDEEEEEEHDDNTTTRRDNSRCCSTASAISRAELESNDSFNPEMIYPVGSSRRAPSADLGNIGGQGELLDEIAQNQINSRSQSSSRTTSLSPRDSFSPHMIHHHHLHHDGGGGSYSSEVEADWALTPPSEEEHVDEDEKNLDRATMLGLESVGMEDLDDVWPGVRRSLGGANGRTGNTIEAQVDGVTSEFEIMEVFEPVLSAAPIPQGDIPSPILFSLSNTTMTTDADDTITTTMEIDPTPMDEHAAAAMFIADESLHPPKPAPILTVTAASEAGDASAPQPSLSPVSAATRDATITADAHAPTSNAVNILQQNSAADSIDRDSTTPVQQHQQVQSSLRQQEAQPTSTQSFLFYPENPFHPEISILLTDTKILFYSTIVNIPRDGRPLLRRVDNDAVDAEALLLSLEGMGGLDSDRIETLRKIKELGNTWVSLDFARELLNKYGGVDPLLGIFLADDILLAWNEKLVKLGSMLRQKNGLPTPATAKQGEKTTAVKLEQISTSSSSTDIASKSKTSPSTTEKDTKEPPIEVEHIRVESTKEPVVASIPSSSPKKEKITKSNLARRASSRIRPTVT